MKKTRSFLILYKRITSILIDALALACDLARDRDLDHARDRDLDLALALETKGRLEDMAGTQETYADLEVQMSRLNEYLTSLTSVRS